MNKSSGIFRVTGATLIALLITVAGIIENTRAEELYGILTIEDVADSFSINFSQLDTPFSSTGLRPDTMTDPDLILIHQRGVNPAGFVLRAPFTPSITGMTLELRRLMEASGYNKLDSLKHAFLPVLQSVNPRCRQSGQCDSAGGGFFVKTSESGVAFWRPAGAYIGGIDRYYLFWAYSSDGSFGGVTGLKREPGEIPSANVGMIHGEDCALYDLQGRRLNLVVGTIMGKTLRSNRSIVVNGGVPRQTGVLIKIK